MKRLSDEDISLALADLDGWSMSHGKLHREYKFATFANAIGFFAAAAPWIEKKDHHPEWSNVYNRVTVDLVSHDADGVTQRDLDLARHLEALARRLV